jgi:copper transport protein
VVLRFDEAVSTVSGSLRVFDGDARRVDDGEVTQPASDKVAVGLPSALPQDTYTVAWRVLSADSHPVRGAFVFSVGRPVGNGSGVAAQVLDAEAGSGLVDWALAVTRFVGLSLILLCVGGVALLGFAVELRDERAARLWVVVASAAALLAVDSLAWLSLTGVKAAGFGLDAVFRWSLARDVVETSFGKVWIARAVLALALAGVGVVLRRRRSEALLGAAVFLASAIAVTPALSGHARVEGAFAILSDCVHVLAAGVWVGGLAFLALLLVTAGGERWSLATKVVPRFSLLAVVSVIALVSAGVVSGFLEVRSWNGLWETTYGRLLLAKIALLIPLIGLGAFNNRVSVPRLRAQDTGPRVRRRFVRSVALELTLMVVVVGVTAALVAEPPAKAQLAAAGGPVSRDTRIGPFDLNVVVDPARTGSNEIHLYLLDRSTGQPVRVDEVKVSASLPAADLGPLRFTAIPAGPGHAVVPAASLPFVGSWRLLVEARRGDFDQWSTTVNIPIRKDDSKS